eukprot:3528100-Alexandrium_andersonii.AAC.1
MHASVRTQRTSMGDPWRIAHLLQHAHTRAHTEWLSECTSVPCLVGYMRAPAQNATTPEPAAYFDRVKADICKFVYVGPGTGEAKHPTRKDTTNNCNHLARGSTAKTKAKRAHQTNTQCYRAVQTLSLIHISEPTRLALI